MPSDEFGEIASSTCCIVPMYNEEQVISQVVTDLRSIFPHVICIDDGSNDKSAAKALEAGALVLRHVVNIGPFRRTSNEIEGVFDIRICCNNKN